jgi:hypothetical protein
LELVVAIVAELQEVSTLADSNRTTADRLRPTVADRLGLPKSTNMLPPFITLPARSRSLGRFFRPSRHE